jgi:succinate dehydrogenase flavin-adding protein (antitoxin of CptAB toxin-antitoxin module)
MISYEELHTQNHKITELSNLLEHVLTERTLCDNGECCHLFSKYMAEVNQHMDVVDRNLYSELLLSEDVKLNNTAKSFMNGTVEIRRIMKQYVSKWCNKTDNRFTFGSKGKDYDQFLEDSKQMFSIILDRIQKETEGLYPLVRQLQDEQRRAA